MSIESTKPAAVEAHKPVPQPQMDLASSIWKEALDFGQGVYHGAVEAPVNGVVQLANHVSGAHLPELHLTNEKEVDRTIAGKIGSVVGTTADMVGLTLATGGLGGTGAVATGLRLAAVGATFSGVLQPSAENSKHFFADRATSAVVGAAAFGAMGAAAAGLEVAGVFAAPVARTLADNMIMGAVDGAAGGAVHSEATALLKQGKALPTFSDFAGDVASYATFGAAFGAAAYGIQRIGNPLDKIAIGNKQVTLYSDRSGSPVRVDAVLGSKADPSEKINWTAIKNADGTWNSTAQQKFDTDVYAPQVDSVVKDPDGSITIAGKYEARRFGSDGTYTLRNLSQEESDAKSAAQAVEAARTANVVVNDPNDASRTYDYTGRLVYLKGGTNDGLNAASLTYGKSGDISNVSLSSNDQGVSINQTSNEPGSYNVRIGDSQYKFTGSIKTTSTQADGKADTLVFQPKDGAALTYTPATAHNFVEAAKSSMTLEPGKGGAPLISVDESGKIKISGGTSYRIPIINGKEVPHGESAEVKPGDTLAIRADIGDAYPVWETQPVQWAQTANGSLQLPDMVVKPNTVGDLVARKY